MLFGENTDHLMDMTRINFDDFYECYSKNV